MIGVTSLDLVAYPIRHCQKLIVAAVDARRDEIFHANYRQVREAFKGFLSRRYFAEDLSAELLASNDEVRLLGMGLFAMPTILKTLKG